MASEAAARPLRHAGRVEPQIESVRRVSGSFEGHRCLPAGKRRRVPFISNYFDLCSNDEGAVLLDSRDLAHLSVGSLQWPDEGRRLIVQRDGTGVQRRTVLCRGCRLIPSAHRMRAL